MNSSRHTPVFPLLVPLRVRQLQKRIEPLLYSAPEPVPCELVSCVPEYLSLASVRRRRGKPIEPGQPWGRVFDQAWFRLQLPKSAGGKFLRWEDQGEGTLHVNGRAVAGFDVAHRHVQLPAQPRDAWVEAICAQAAIWHPDATGLDPRGSIWRGAALVERDPVAWEIHHRLGVLVDLMIEEFGTTYPQIPDLFGIIGTKPPLLEASPLLRWLLRRLDEAVDIHDRDGRPALNRALRAIFRDLPAGSNAFRLTLSGHAHIDLVWLWPERVGERKAVHSFATMDYLLGRYPELRVSYSQPISYDAVARIDPELRRRIGRHIEAGTWEATGGMLVESDTQLPCGEALLRCFSYGQEWFERETGRRTEVCWLPDCMGFSACLPQLMAGFGLKFVFTNKIFWNAVTTFPYSSFVWRGLDGSEVLAHAGRHTNCYNGNAVLPELTQAARRHFQADVHPEALVCTGFGDGGGGPTEEQCERARLLDRLPGRPAVGWDTPGGFFQRLAPLRAKLPVHHGEIYLEYHRGIASTHGHYKAAFRALERALQTWEAARVLRGGSPVPESVWRRLVFAQFHDNIPGSSIHDVYAEAGPELRRLTDEAHAAALAEISAGARRPAPPLVLFNPLPQVVRHVPDERVAAWSELPPVSSVRLEDLPVRQDAPVTARTTELANGRLRARFNRLGEIDSLVVDGRAILLDGPVNRLAVIADLPHAFETWDVDASWRTCALPSPAGDVTGEVVKNLPGAGEVVFRRPLTDRSSIAIHYRLQTGSAALEIEYVVDWQDPDRLLKALFPTRYLGRDARFGAPFGSTLRPQLPAGLEDEAKWEVFGSRWAAVMDATEREGLFLAAEAKFGFSCRMGELGVTLLRSALWTGGPTEGHRGGLPEARRHPAERPSHTDLGRHSIRVVLGAHSLDAPREEAAAAVAESRFTRPIPFLGASGDAGFLGIDGDPTLQPAWVLPRDKNSWTLRLHETHGARGRVQLRLAPGWAAFRTGMDGRVPGKRLGGGRLSYGPHEIVTVRIERTPASPRAKARK